MLFKDDHLTNDRDSQQQTGAKAERAANRADDDDNMTEEDLKRRFLFGKGDDVAHPTEGKGQGGHNFGKENNTPAGDDKNNPSRNAGYSNAYFARTEPSEEHPEDANFTAKQQEGAPDYGKARPSAISSGPKPEKPERGNGENDRPNPQSPYREGTADNDGGKQPNIPGPEELPEQQKVGENNKDDEREHIET